MRQRQQLRQRNPMILKMNPNSDLGRNEIFKVYSNIINRSQVPYGLNMPSDKSSYVLGFNQTLANYAVIDKYEIDSQTSQIFNVDQEIEDDYLAVALAAGDSVFLNANGFPNNLYELTLPQLQQQIVNRFPNQVNVFSQNIRIDSAVDPILLPTSQPTSPPTLCPSIPTMPSCPKKEKLSVGKQLYFSFIGALIFILISLPFVYDFTNSIFRNIGLYTQTKYGCPTYTGIIIHFVVYFILIFGIMKLFEYLHN